METDIAVQELIDRERALEARIRYLEDRQAIRDCLVRLARGDDRLDRELVLSAYHPDAVDDHLGFCGGPEEFFDWIYNSHTRAMTSTQHHLTNQTCDIDGDVANTETYFIFTSSNLNGTNSISTGRYLDRLERRDDQWKIAFRYCIIETMAMVPAEKLPFARAPERHANGEPSQSRSDPSYAKPRFNKRARLVPPDTANYEDRTYFLDQ